MVPVESYFTANGTYVSPVGTKYLKVYLVGGGGGGAGGGATATFGSGGGAGMPAFKYYPPGTYSYTIGTGGAGGAVDTSGSNGTSTVFDTLDVYAISTALNGRGGDTLPPQAGSSSGTTTNGVLMAVIMSQPGADDSVSFCGNGGLNSFGRNGTGAFYTGLSKNGIGSSRSGGGSGGCGATGTGGPGAAGFIKVIAYL